MTEQELLDAARQTPLSEQTAEVLLYSKRRIEDAIRRILSSGDSIAVVKINPKDEAIFNDILNELPIQGSLNIETDDKVVGLPVFIPHSFIEAQFLEEWANKIGLMTYLAAKGSPVVPGYHELKIAYINQAVAKCLEEMDRRGIVTVSSAIKL